MFSLVSGSDTQILVYFVYNDRSSDSCFLLSSSSAFRLALIQLQVSSVKSDNLTRACGLIWEAAKQGAKIVSLPVSMEAATPFWGLLSQQNNVR